MNKKPRINIIAAIGSNRELGKDNKLLWHIPQDLKRFKKLTFGHPVIMGRTTYQSLGKPLSGRVNIVVTHNKDFRAPECIIVHSLKEAIVKAKSSFTKATKDKEIFIIGGGQVYSQAINFADKLYLTIIEGSFEADTFFPDYSSFKRVIFQKKERDNNYQYAYLELTR